MILYNITFNIEPEIQNDWLAWIKNEYFPFALDTGLFLDVKMYRLLNETENQGLTYSVQFFSDSLEKVNTYLENYAPEIVERHNEAFKYKHVSFMTILESID
ncbi:MAG: DUF4286 family protein [Cyclobacteriaceae bacterium]|nr:DUF4286 family protein [Cyclobacteriaceae bacterium]MCK5207689.1 DUF4286 family protein [Cyclobacteriaceae bacterium]MCK5279805.1 DUF4286 family protein [Cyclobacteriaceae bacterium]MCK5372477.1 DUF4286 family protein [Cyclobacteriaceae bacterium]MCK5703276.1 DUF4286 family protein [Cyclobacteriaceae bacterium]